MRVMARLNLTLDMETFKRLEKHARKTRSKRATLAKTLIGEALERREVMQRRRKLAFDYAADRGDTRDLLRDLEAGELELFD
jgi:predicted transcriptional regulator